MNPIEFDLEKKIENHITEMANLGLFGTIKEFYLWYYFLFNDLEINYKSFSKVFHNLIANKVFINNQNLRNEYIYNNQISFSNFVEFISPANLLYSPIQFVRSRLISFLNYFGVQEGILYDIVIGVVEAVENAVKYSSDDKIYVKYFIENNIFYVEIQNRYKEPEVDQDISKGKYDSSKTLMRGMVVMSKLFDEMDIDLIQNREIAIFYAKKILKFKDQK